MTSIKNIILVLCLLLPLRTIPSAYAEDVAEERTYRSSAYQELGTIVVTARRVPFDKTQIAENVTVYTEEDISRLPARDLGEVLSTMPGVDVSLNGQFGQSTALSINGSSARQVLLMIDGIPFNTQLSGQANPAQIPIEHIARIEVIKGASSSAWGSALGGVINVITKDVGDSVTPSGSFTSSFAEFSTTKNSLDLAGKIKELGYFVAGSYLSTHGAQAVTDVEEKKLFSKLSLPLSDEAKVVGSFGYNEADTRYALTAGSSISTQLYYTRYGKLQLNVAKNDFHWNAALKYNHQEITTITSITTASSNVYKGISLNASRDISDYGTLVMGVDFDWHTLKSNRYLDSSKSINMQAPYANHTLEWNDWEFITGIRFDNNDRFGSQTSPSFGAVYHFNDPHGTLIRTRVARGFNAPPLLWLFNDDPPFVVANPDLKAERSIVYEVGMETNLFSSLGVDLNLYRADVKDAIALNRSTFKQENFRKFRRQGVELLLNYQVNNDLALYGSGAFNDVKNRTTGKTVRDSGIARHKFTFGTHYKNEQGFGFNLSGYYNRWSSAPSESNDRKPMFDLKLTKEFKDVKNDMDLEIFLNIHNLTNSKYWANRSLPFPRRYFEGGFSVKF